MIIEKNDLYQSNLFSFLSRTDNNSIKISASSTYPDLTSNDRSTIDAILDCSEKRWVSGYEKNPSFLIEFPFGSFYIQSYIIRSRKDIRYTYQWKIDGLTASGWKLIDEQNRDDMCSEPIGNHCPHEINKIFIVANPCYVSKLLFTSTGVDSVNENIFSLTQLMLYGQYERRRFCYIPLWRSSVILSALLNFT